MRKHLYFNFLSYVYLTVNHKLYMVNQLILTKMSLLPPNFLPMTIVKAMTKVCTFLHLILLLFHCLYLPTLSCILYHGSQPWVTQVLFDCCFLHYWSGFLGIAVQEHLGYLQQETLMYTHATLCFSNEVGCNPWKLMANKHCSSSRCYKIL